MDEYRPVLARREYTRSKLETAGRLLVQGKEILIHCWDYSERGLGAFSNTLLPVREKIAVKFSLPGTERLAAKAGRIAWCEEVGRNHYRFGVDFDPGQ